MSIVHDTSTLPPGEQFDYWRDVVCEGVFETQADPLGRAPFEARIHLHRIGQVDLCIGQFPEHRMVRGRAQIARVSEPAFCLHLVEGGTIQSRYRRDLCSGPGDMLIGDMTTPMERTYRGQLKATLVHVPKELLETRLRLEMDMPLALDGREGMGALLAGYVRSLAGAASTLTPEASRQASDILCDLMVAAIAPLTQALEPVQGGIRSARLTAAKRYIMDGINDPDLNAEKVARHLGVSVRYVHKLFETADHSFAESITLARLDACREALRMPAEDHRTIADIAFAHGFNDLSAFYRRYRARWGETPGDTRHHATRRPAA